MRLTLPEKFLTLKYSSIVNVAKIHAFFVVIAKIYAYWLVNNL